MEKQLSKRSGLAEGKYLVFTLLYLSALNLICKYENFGLINVHANVLSIPVSFDLFIRVNRD